MKPDYTVFFNRYQLISESECLDNIGKMIMSDITNYLYFLILIITFCKIVEFFSETPSYWTPLSRLWRSVLIWCRGAFIECSRNLCRLCVTDFVLRPQSVSVCHVKMCELLWKTKTPPDRPCPLTWNVITVPRRPTVHCHYMKLCCREHCNVGLTPKPYRLISNNQLPSACGFVRLLSPSRPKLPVDVNLGVNGCLSPRVGLLIGLWPIQDALYILPSHVSGNWFQPLPWPSTHTVNAVDNREMEWINPVWLCFMNSRSVIFGSVCPCDKQIIFSPISVDIRFFCFQNWIFFSAAHLCFNLIQLSSLYQTLHEDWKEKSCFLYSFMCHRNCVVAYKTLIFTSVLYPASWYNIKHSGYNDCSRGGCLIQCTVSNKTTLLPL